MAGVEIPVRGEQRWMHFTPQDGGLPARLPLTVDFSTGFYFHREGPGLAFGGREQSLEELAVPAARRLPVLGDLPVQSSWWGYYEVSPDYNAIVGEAEEPSRFLYATGFSGHGFQQAPAVGEHVAELVAGLTPTLDLSPFSARALRAGRGPSGSLRHLMRRTLIVNPNASRVTEERIAEVEARLRPEETLRTERRGHATELARNAAGDEVWVLGGDGVVNEALNGIRDGVALGVVPAGGANVVARALGARERRISVGRVNGRRFAFSAGIGVDSEVVRRAGDPATGAERPPLQQPSVRARRSGAAAPRFRITARGGRAGARGRDLRLERRGLHVRGSLPLRFLPDARFELGLDFAAPVRVTPLSSASLFTRVLAGRGMAESVGRAHRPRSRPHRGSLRRSAAAPGGRRRPWGRARGHLRGRARRGDRPLVTAHRRLSSCRR